MVKRIIFIISLSLSGFLLQGCKNGLLSGTYEGLKVSSFGDSKFKPLTEHVKYQFVSSTDCLHTDDYDEPGAITSPCTYKVDGDNVIIDGLAFKLDGDTLLYSVGDKTNGLVTMSLKKQ